MKEKIAWPLVGNKHIIDFLEKSITNKKTSNAYLFNGADDLGKTTLAIFFAKLLLCRNKSTLPCGICSSCKVFAQNGANHPDFHLLKKSKDKKNISIIQTREFIRMINMSSFTSTKKVGIIKHADKMSMEAFNSLLKTLEEVKLGTVVILAVNDISRIPDTIKSRCQILNFRPVAFDDIYHFLTKEKSVSRNSARDYAKICLGRPALALKFLEEKDFYRTYMERMMVFLDFFKLNLHERLRFAEKLLQEEKGEAATSSAKRILNVWSGVVRDLMLIRMNNVKFIQHQYIFNTINDGNFLIPNYSKLLEINKRIYRAKDYINYNINPKTALFSVVAGI